MVSVLRAFQSDTLRRDAEKAIQAFYRQHIGLSIVSGDQSQSVMQIAKDLKIQHFSAEQTPAEKLVYLQGLQARGEEVAVVGDGINDAPMLAAAHISIAMGSGAAMAQSQADMILSSNRLMHLPLAFDVTRRTSSIIYQNLGWALLYNLCALPLAVTGELPPYLAAIGMSASSLIVTLNSLRLLRIKRFI